jgi:hypothetical protein
LPKKPYITPTYFIIVAVRPERRGPMADILLFVDSLGPAKIIQMFEPSVDLKALLMVDNVAMKPTRGYPDSASCVRGRMFPDGVLDDPQNAMASLPQGRESPDLR